MRRKLICAFFLYVNTVREKAHKTETGRVARTKMKFQTVVKCLYLFFLKCNFARTDQNYVLSAGLNKRDRHLFLWQILLTDGLRDDCNTPAPVRALVSSFYVRDPPKQVRMYNVTTFRATGAVFFYLWCICTRGDH